MVSRPTLPEGPAVVTGGTQCVVADLRSRAILFPRAAVFAYRDDRGRLPLDDGGVAPARAYIEELLPEIETR